MAKKDNIGKFILFVIIWGGGMVGILFGMEALNFLGWAWIIAIAYTIFLFRFFNPLDY